MHGRSRQRSVGWSAIFVPNLVGNWFCAFDHHGCWRGFVERITVDTLAELVTIEARDLQHARTADEFYLSTSEPMPPFSIHHGYATFLEGRRTHWRTGETCIKFAPPRPKKVPRVNPTLLYSSGGAHLRKFL